MVPKFHPPIKELKTFCLIPPYYLPPLPLQSLRHLRALCTGHRVLQSELCFAQRHVDLLLRLDTSSASSRPTTAEPSTPAESPAWSKDCLAF